MYLIGRKSSLAYFGAHLMLPINFLAEDRQSFHNFFSECLVLQADEGFGLCSHIILFLRIGFCSLSLLISIHCIKYYLSYLLRIFSYILLYFPLFTNLNQIMTYIALFHGRATLISCALIIFLMVGKLCVNKFAFFGILLCFMQTNSNSIPIHLMDLKLSIGVKKVKIKTAFSKQIKRKPSSNKQAYNLSKSKMKYLNNIMELSLRQPFSSLHYCVLLKKLRYKPIFTYF